MKELTTEASTRLSIQSVFGPLPEGPHVGQMVQLRDWPSNQWAEVISSSSADSASQVIKLVLYSADGASRFTQTVSVDAVCTHVDKLDVPPLDFVSGVVSLSNGLLGHTRRRWPTKINSQADFHHSAPERFH